MFPGVVFFSLLLAAAVNRSVLCEPVCVIRITDTNKHCHSVSQWKSDLRCRLMEASGRLVHSGEGVHQSSRERALVSKNDI